MIEIMWRASRLRGCFAGPDMGRRAGMAIYHYQHIDNNNMIDIVVA